LALGALLNGLGAHTVKRFPPNVFSIRPLKKIFLFLVGVASEIRPPHFYNDVPDAFNPFKNISDVPYIIPDAFLAF
jgi:hypothetical protein